MEEEANPMPGFTHNSYNFIDKDPVVDRLRTTVQASSLPYKEIAVRAGVAPTTVQNLFSGKTRSPSYRTIIAIGSAFGMKLAWE